jgi:hypothetical protein
MALIWDTTISGLMLNRGIKMAMAATVAITVYKGTQPSQADITANWPSYKTGSTDFLCHYSGSVWTQQPAHGNLLGMSTVPTASSNAQQSGTATWAILWMTNPLIGVMSSDTIPTINFMVVPCSDSIGNGVIRYQDPLFEVGQPKPITEASLTSLV